MLDPRLRRLREQGAVLGRELLALFPLGTAILAAAAVAASLWPALLRVLIDWREIRLGTGAWRPLTGHLAHASPVHLLLNLALFVPFGAARERRVGTERFLLEYVLLAAAVAAGVRCLHGGWSTYCGLSGVVYGLVAAHCLAERQGWGLAVIAALALKTALELGQGGWIAGAPGLEQALGVTYLPGAHAAGLAAGACLARVTPRRRTSVAQTTSAAT